MSQIFDFISSIVGSLAWPLSAIIIAILLRNPISRLLARLGKIKYGEIEAEFTKGLEEIKMNIEESKKSRELNIVGVSENTVQYNNNPLSIEVEEIAKTSPLAAIPFAWSKIEYALSQKAKNSNLIENYYVQPQKIATQFLKEEKISASTYSAINTMRQLRNSVSHNHNISSELTVNDAIEYGRNAEYVILEINSIS